MNAEELEQLQRTFQSFIDEESSKGADEGLACEVATALLNEAQSGGEGCLKNLPPLKRALLEYIVEQAQQADAQEEGQAPEESQGQRPT